MILNTEYFHLFERNHLGFYLCVGSLVKIAFENSNFNPWNTPHLLLMMIVFLLIIINALLVSELVSCNAEYAQAIIEYES